MLRLKDIGKQSDVLHVLLRSVSKRNCNVRTSSVAFTEELSVNIGCGNFSYSGGLLLLLLFFITSYTAAHKHTNTKKAKIHLKYDVKYKKDINTNNVSTLFAYTRRPGHAPFPVAHIVPPSSGLVPGLYHPSQRCGLCQNFKQTTLTTILYQVRTNLYPPPTYENVPTRSPLPHK